MARSENRRVGYGIHRTWLHRHEKDNENLRPGHLCRRGTVVAGLPRGGRHEKKCFRIGTYRSLTNSQADSPVCSFVWRETARNRTLGSSSLCLASVE